MLDIEYVEILHNLLFQKYPLRYLLSCNLIGSKYKQFLEIQDNNSVSGSAYKNLNEWKHLAERQK